MIEVCIEQAAGRVPVIAGCGSNDTNNAILHLNFSKKSGAAAGLVVAPYYNRPNQEVSGLMSVTVRAGTLYSTIGKSFFLVIASKCA